jgi:hypothetical protein
MLQDLMTVLQSASGQISHALAGQPTTARKKRAGRIALPITTLVVPIHAVQIQDQSGSQHLVLTVLGNHAHQELTDLLLTDRTQTEELAEEATTAQSVQPDQTQIALGNLVLLAPTDLLLTGTTQTDHQELEATTAQSVQHDQTQIVLGSHALQEPIVQSAQGTLVASHLVQIRASMTETATRSARTAFRETVQEMTASLALATRTPTRRHSLRTRF